MSRDTTERDVRAIQSLMFPVAKNLGITAEMQRQAYAVEQQSARYVAENTEAGGRAPEAPARMPGFNML